MGDPRHGNEPENVQVVRAAAGGSFGSPTIVSQTVVNPWENIQGPYEHASSVVIDDNGDTVVGYNEASATWSFGSPFTDKLVTSDSGGSFSSPVTLGSANNAGVPQVTIAPDGESTAMTDTSAGALIASSRSLGGSFSSPATTVAPSVEDWTLTAASNVSAANGNALAALAVPTNSDQSHADLKAAVRPAGGFERPNARL